MYLRCHLLQLCAALQIAVRLSSFLWGALGPEVFRVAPICNAYVFNRPRWWTADLQNLRRVFRETDSDGSGYIDMFEFASLLRGWGIMFSPHQFQTAMKQLACSVELRQQRTPSSHPPAAGGGAPAVPPAPNAGPSLGKKTSLTGGRSGYISGMSTPQGPLQTSNGAYHHPGGSGSGMWVSGDWWGVGGVARTDGVCVCGSVYCPLPPAPPPVPADCGIQLRCPC